MFCNLQEIQAGLEEIESYYGKPLINSVNELEPAKETINGLCEKYEGLKLSYEKIRNAVQEEKMQATLASETL